MEIPGLHVALPSQTEGPPPIELIALNWLPLETASHLTGPGCTVGRGIGIVTPTFVLYSLNFLLLIS